MSKTAHEIEFLDIEINRDSEEMLWMQIYKGLRNLIITQQLKAGDQLLSTRAMAQRYRVSRVTVTNAYEQLNIEGYIRQGSGSGTFVCDRIPDNILEIVVGEDAPIQEEREVEEPRKFGKFSPGIADVFEFPFDKWSRLAARTIQNLALSDFNSEDQRGYLALREQISRFIRSSRGVNCHVDDILVTNGILHSMALICDEYLCEGDVVWIEEPCYEVIARLFKSYGAKLEPIPVDDEGLHLKNLEGDAPKLIYVTPSHQYPLGHTMSLKRRLELLEFARKHKTLIIEDDYDSEFRYTGNPVRALSGLDKCCRTIYLGNFNKIMYHGLRISYIVAPDKVLKKLYQQKRISSRGNSVIEQVMLAQFIASGQLQQYIRKMRLHYHEKYQMLAAFVEKEMSDILELVHSDTGLSVATIFKVPVDDVAASKFLKLKGYDIAPLSPSFLNPENPKSGLVIGIGNVYISFFEKELMKLGEEIKKFISDTQT